MKDRTGSAGRGTGKRPGRPRAEAGGGDAATNAPRLRNNPLAWVTAAVTGPDAAPAAASAADTADVGLSPAPTPDAPPSPATATMTKRERRSPARANAMDQSKKRTEDMPTPRKTEAPPAGASDTLTAADFAAYENADAWVAATAMENGLVVISQEISAPDAKRTIKLPDVCKQFKIRHVDTFTFLREVGFRM